MGIEKAKKIAKAWIAPLPVGEDYYEQRISICSGCEYNTKNIEDKSKIKAEHRMLAMVKKEVCTGCGCPVKEKASVKDETCGMKNLGLTPKWFAIEVKDKSVKDLTITNLMAGSSSLNHTEGFFTFYTETEEESVNFSFLVNCQRGFNVINYVAGCSCTYSDVKQNNDREATFDVKISTKSFKVGLNDRTMTINYQMGENTRSLKVRFSILKK